MNPPADLSPELPGEQEALTRLADAGVAKASLALGKLVGGEVSMSVPRVEAVPRAVAARRLEAEFSERLVAVSERFSGPLAGAALLVFPQKSSLDLVRLVLPQEVDPADAAELEGEALGEVGNIVLNNWLATVANLLDAKLQTALPEVLQGNGAEIFASCGVAGGDDSPTLVLTIRFHVRDHDIAGQILVVLDAASEAALRERIARNIDRIAGAGATPAPQT